jgi:TolB protein
MNSDGGVVRNLSRSGAVDINPSWSPDGTRIAFASNREGLFALYGMDPDGGNVRRIGAGGGVLPQWSPDARSLCFERDGVVWVTTIEGRERRIAEGERCAWSADGTEIVFDRDVAKTREIYAAPAGGGDVVCLTRNGRGNGGPATSRDGLRIAFNSNADGSRFGIFTMRPDGTDQARLTGRGTFDEHPGWSPVGRWVAFSSARDGNKEIYKVAVR